MEIGASICTCFQLSCSCRYHRHQDWKKAYFCPELMIVPQPCCYCAHKTRQLNGYATVPCQSLTVFLIGPKDYNACKRSWKFKEKKIQYMKPSLFEVKYVAPSLLQDKFRPVHTGWNHSKIIVVPRKCKKENLCNKRTKFNHQNDKTWNHCFLFIKSNYIFDCHFFKWSWKNQL